MTMIPRRRWLQGAGALILAAGPAKAAETTLYDYLFLDLDDAKSGATPARAYAEFVRTRTACIVAAAFELEPLGVDLQRHGIEPPGPYPPTAIVHRRQVPGGCGSGGDRTGLRWANTG